MRKPVDHAKRPNPMPVIDGRRIDRERELLTEFLRPGIDNLERIKALGTALRRRAQLRSVPKPR